MNYFSMIGVWPKLELLSNPATGKQTSKGNTHTHIYWPFLIKLQKMFFSKRNVHLMRIRRLIIDYYSVHQLLFCYQLEEHLISITETNTRWIINTANFFLKFKFLTVCPHKNFVYEHVNRRSKHNCSLDNREVPSLGLLQGSLPSVSRSPPGACPLSELLDAVVPVIPVCEGAEVYVFQVMENHIGNWSLESLYLTIWRVRTV